MNVKISCQLPATNLRLAAYRIADGLGAGGWPLAAESNNFFVILFV
jgi:hypothetical protein